MKMESLDVGEISEHIANDPHHQGEWYVWRCFGCGDGPCYVVMAENDGTPRCVLTPHDALFVPQPYDSNREE